MKYFLIIFLSIVLFSGCAKYNKNSGYAKFFKQSTNIQFEPTTSITFKEMDISNELILKLKDGYGVIGSSDFSSAEKINLDELKEFGKILGADTILGTKEYLRTSSGVMPFRQFHSGKTYTMNTYGNSNTRMNGWNTNGTQAYGNSYGTYNSNSTITTPGYSTTEYIPYQKDVNEYHIYFLKKIDTSKMKFGATFKIIDSQTRAKLSTNMGCQINYVYNDTLAFKSDIMDFDIILETNNNEIFSCDDYQKILLNSTNETLNLVIWRQGILLNKKIKLQ